MGKLTEATHAEIDHTGIPGAGGGGGGGHVIKESGTPLSTRAGLNFTTGLTATDDAGGDETEVAIDETVVETVTGSQAKVDAHTGDATDAHDASAISFSPVGTIAGTDVQTAVAEVATDAAAALSTHEADTSSVHGISDTTALYRAGGTDVAVADGGTGASTAADARTNLGAAAASHTHAIGDITTDLATQAELDAHAADTTAVHGIADTADLATHDYADDAVSVHGGLDTNTHGATTGASKIAKIVTPAGTGEFIYVDEESTPSTPANVGDIRIVVPDGFF